MPNRFSMFEWVTLLTVTYTNSCVQLHNINFSFTANDLWCTRIFIIMCFSWFWCLGFDVWVFRLFLSFHLHLSYIGELPLFVPVIIIPALVSVAVFILRNKVARLMFIPNLDDQDASFRLTPTHGIFPAW